MRDEPCTRDDLQAIRPILTYWSVANAGHAIECVFENDDALDIEQYICDNCAKAWRPDFDGMSDLKQCWQAALDHLPSVRTSDEKIVKVDVAT